MKKQDDWIRYVIVIRAGKRNGKMPVVAINVDGAAIRPIEFQTREYEFGVIGLNGRFNEPGVALGVGG